MDFNLSPFIWRISITVSTEVFETYDDSSTLSSAVKRLGGRLPCSLTPCMAAETTSLGICGLIVCGSPVSKESESRGNWRIASSVQRPIQRRLKFQGGGISRRLHRKTDKDPEC